MKKGLIVVLSGPAGSGKGTVREKLLKDPAYAFSVSDTTRAPRPGEIAGKDYNYISTEEFLSHIEKNEMLEYTNYCGNYYGTPKKAAEEVIASGRNLLLEIEVEGAMNVKRAYPEAVLIMLLPPSFAVQEKRLRERGTESEEKILARLARAKEELKFLPQYDYVVCNPEGKAEECLENIRSIVYAEQFSAKRNASLMTDYFT